MTHIEKKILPLHKYVCETLENYFEKLGDYKPSNLYQLVLDEIEAPLFATTMKYVKNNQCEAANILGISRGTLRKKLKRFHIDVA